MLHEIGGLHPHRAHVLQAKAIRLSIEFAQAPQQTFDANEIALGMELGVLRQKSPIAAAQFNFTTLANGKQLPKVHALDDGTERMNEGYGGDGSLKGVRVQ